MIPSVSNESRLIRIGTFYDGNYFSHVSNYYLHHHSRKARISISGLHEFIASEISKLENVPKNYCRIVDAHYFRGRLSANEAHSKNKLYGERLFDEVLMRAGVVSHFLPLSAGGEKGIDVWLALEAFELSLHKRFDVVVLVAGDGDYLPLIRKINTIGTRIMVIGWDFSYVNEQGGERKTRTAQTILDEATYPMLMSSIIDDRSRNTDSSINNLFLQTKQESSGNNANSELPSNHDVDGIITGTIKIIGEKYGFIDIPSSKRGLYFDRDGSGNKDFDNLSVGDKVTYIESKNDLGPCAINIRKL